MSFGKIGRTVSFHNFKSQNFKSSVSNPKSKYVAYSSVLSRISNCQGLGRKNTFDILKTYRRPSPPTKSLGFGGFDSSRLLILRGRAFLCPLNFIRSLPESLTQGLNRTTLNRWTGRRGRLLHTSKSAPQKSVLIVVAFSSGLSVVVFEEMAGPRFPD